MHDILSHHTKMSMEGDVMDIATQMVDTALASNHSYSHLHQFTRQDGRVTLSNTSHGSSYFQVDSRFAYYDALD